MKRRNFLQLSGYSTMIPLLKGSFLGPTIWSEHKMIPIRKNVGIFLERGGTIGWLLSEDAQVVVDSQFPEQAGHLIDEIKKKDFNQIDALINTHHHGDHTGGNVAFKGMVDYVIAHTHAVENQKRTAHARGSEDKQLFADHTFDKSWETDFGSEHISCKYFGPAHTNGDIIIHFENANVAHLGDLIFNRRFPYIDKSAGASIQNWIQVLDQVNATFDEDTIFIFGHAGEGHEVTGTKEDVQAFRNYLEQLMDYMNKQLANNKTKEEIIQSTTTIPGANEWQGNGVQRSIEAAWEELHEGKN